MTVQDRIQHGARFLLDERKAHKPFASIPEPFTPRSLQEAYGVQDELMNLLSASGGAVAGYKIALTTQVAQKIVGYREPVAGTVLARTIYESPYSIRASEYVNLGVECEIAIRLGAALPADRAPWSRARVTDAVETVMAAFELVDDRNADYTMLASQILTGIADNVWNAGVVLGPTMTNGASLDLAQARGVMRVNGNAVGEGRGRDVMGHPLEALTWLANMLASRGKSLEQGMIVVTGSFIALEFIHPGDTVSALVEGLGRYTCEWCSACLCMLQESVS